ncbi:MAG: hypothetical protein QXN68_01100 [Thermoplasmata archaeon]
MDKLNISLYKECVNLYYKLHNEYYEIYRDNAGGKPFDIIVVEGPDKVGKTTYIRDRFGDNRVYTVIREERKNFVENIDYIIGFSVIRNNNMPRVFNELSTGKTVVFDRYFYSTIVYNLLYKIATNQNIFERMDNNIYLFEDSLRFVFMMAYYVFPSEVIFLRRQVAELNPYDPYERNYDYSLLIKIYNDVLNDEKIKYVKIKKL